MSKRNYKQYPEEDTGIWALWEGISTLYILYLIAQYFINRTNFWRWLWYGVAVFASTLLVAWLFNKIKIRIKRKKIGRIINKIQEKGLENGINNFITRFGMGQEKNRRMWKFRNYRIGWDRIHDLENFFEDSGIYFTNSEVSLALMHYIDKRERNFTSKSMGADIISFSSINGPDFEKLLHRLYEKMGYIVNLIGGVGDQGGDLVAVKDKERILIQAKCYRDWNVGNKAIQEAAAAMNHYDCNKAVVVTTSNNFTKAAIELARTNGVELISKTLLQKMLLDNLGESWK